MKFVQINQYLTPSPLDYPVEYIATATPSMVWLWPYTLQDNLITMLDVAVMSITANQFWQVEVASPLLQSVSNSELFS